MCAAIWSIIKPNTPKCDSVKSLSVAHPILLIEEKCFNKGI